MTHDEALHLLSARIDGPLAPDQARGLDAWLAEGADNRVLAEAFQAQHIDLSSAFVPRREAAAKTAAAVARQLPPTVASAPPGQSARPAGWRRRLASPLSGGVAAALLVTAGLYFFHAKTNPDAKPPGLHSDGNLLADVGMKPRAKPIAPKTVVLGIGESASTKAGEKRRVVLPDGSLVYLNQNTSIELPKDRQVKLLAGEVFIEAIPADAKLGKFLVETPKRAVTALGTKFAVSANAKGTGVVVTQGKVEVSGLESKLTTGQELLPGVDAIAAAPRASACGAAFTGINSPKS